MMQDLPQPEICTDHRISGLQIKGSRRHGRYDYVLPLGWLFGGLAEGVGFEPTVGKPTPVFKTGTFGRSVIPPGTTLVDAYFFLWRR